MKRLYISVDNEGIAGTTTMLGQGMPGSFEYERMREWMTNEALAVIEAATEHGIEEFVVADSHGNAENLLIEKFPKNTTIVRSWPRPLSMADGVETGPFVGGALIGYHAAANAPSGTQRHTMLGIFNEVKLNGERASETTLHAAIAGEFGVPIILTSGDDAYIEHAHELLGDIETVTTKWTRGMLSVRTHTPERSAELIYEATDRALKRIEEFKPFKMEGPILVEFTFRHCMNTEYVSYLPNVEVTGALTAQIELPDIISVSRFITFLTMYKQKPVV